MSIPKVAGILNKSRLVSVCLLLSSCRQHKATKCQHDELILMIVVHVPHDLTDPLRCGEMFNAALRPVVIALGFHQIDRVVDPTLTGSSVTFNWTAGMGATAYWIDVGSSAGGNQYFQSGNLGNVLTTTVNGLPTNGSTVYVTLYSLVDGQWLNNQYTYTAYNAGSALGVMQTPIPGSTLSGNVATFTWSAGSGATAYWMDVGSTVGGNNYYQSGNLGNVLTTTVYSLPANGSQIYVTLWSLVGGQWYYNEYNYTSGP